MSCSFCKKKFGVFGGVKKASPDGKCWSCQRAACSKCCRQYNGVELGWVSSHACCGGCSAALDKQKAKLAAQGRLAETSRQELARDAVRSIPEWTLPAQPKVQQQQPEQQQQDKQQDKQQQQPSSAPSSQPRLLALGERREEAKRASRVLLQAVLENYADRSQTPLKSGVRMAGDGNDGEEEDDDVVDDDSDSRDLDSPRRSSRRERSQQPQQPQPEHPARETELLTPSSRLREEDAALQRKRLSQGVLASLDELNVISKQLNKSYTTPQRVDDAEFFDELANQVQTPVKPVVRDANGPFELDFEKELASLDALQEQVVQPSLPPTINISGELGKIETPEAVRTRRAWEKQLESPVASHVEPAQPEQGIVEDTIVGIVEDEPLDMLPMGELGEEATHPEDAALLAELNSLQLPPTIKVNLEAENPMESIGDALTTIASSGDNPDANIAMHEDLIEALADVRREQRDAKLLTMLDVVEEKIRSSLVNASTPKLKRKVEHKENKYRVGQVIAARNKTDGCWYPAKIADTEAEERRYQVQFLGETDRTQLVNEEEEVREFLVGHRVTALYKPDMLGLYREGVVEYITPQGQYRIRFDGEKQPQVVSPNEVQKPKTQQQSQQPQQPQKAEAGQQERRAANPSAANTRTMAQRAVTYISAWLKEARNTIGNSTVELASDRREVVVAAQVAGHLRQMFEVPQAQQQPFALRLPPATSGALSAEDAARHRALQRAAVLCCDHLLTRMQQLLTLVQHPKAEGEKLAAVASKVMRMADWLRSVSDRIKNV